MAEGYELSYQRAQEVLRALLGLPPAQQLIGVSPTLFATFDALAFFDVREQVGSILTIADSAPGANNINAAFAVPAGQVWLLDALTVIGFNPATSGSGSYNARIGTTRNGVLVTFTAIESTTMIGLPGAPANGESRKGVRFFPPFLMHAGDTITAQFANPAASVGNLTGCRAHVLYRPLLTRL